MALVVLRVIYGLHPCIVRMRPRDGLGHVERHGPEDGHVAGQLDDGVAPALHRLDTVAAERLVRIIEPAAVALEPVSNWSCCL